MIVRKYLASQPPFLQNLVVIQVLAGGDGQVVVLVQTADRCERRADDQPHAPADESMVASSQPVI